MKWGIGKMRAVEIIPATLYKGIARCGLAWAKARPWAKRLSWQTRGGAVEVAAGVGRERSQACLSILREYSPVVPH